MSKSTDTCPVCGTSDHVRSTLPRDAHRLLCVNHPQDLFFTPEPTIEQLAQTRGFVLAVEVPAHPHDALELRLARDDLRTDGWRGEALRVRDGDQVFVVFVEPRVANGVKLLQPDPDKLRTAIAEYRQRHARARTEVAGLIDERLFMGVDYGSKVDEGCVVVVEVQPDGRRTVLSYGGPGSRLLAWVQSLRSSTDQEATVELSAEEWAKFTQETA